MFNPLPENLLCRLEVVHLFGYSVGRICQFEIIILAVNCVAQHQHLSGRNKAVVISSEQVFVCSAVSD